MNSTLLTVASEIVAAYVSKNSLPATELPSMIRSVHDALAGLGKPETPNDEKLEPKVSIKKSVTADYIICLEDGRRFKSLRRHLNTIFNMSPDEYRAKWGLAQRLSHDGSELFVQTIGACQNHRARPKDGIEGG